jgi:hypothetical protein
MYVKYLRSGRNYPYCSKLNCEVGRPNLVVFVAWKLVTTGNADIVAGGHLRS